MKKTAIIFLAIVSVLFFSGFKCQGLEGIDFEGGPFGGGRVLEQNPAPPTDYSAEALANAQPWETNRRFVRTDQVGWLYTWGGRGQDWGTCVVTDYAGSVYVGAKYSSTIDLNPGSGVDEHRNNDCEIVLIKFGPDGQYVWGKELGTGSHWQGYIYNMTIDDNGDLFVLTSPMSTKFQMNKVSSDGEILWTRNFVSRPDSRDNVEIVTDAEGNVYIAGVLRDREDFDPGEGVDEQGVNNNIEQAFLTSYSSDGEYRWSRTWAVGERNPVNGLATDSEGNVVLLGTFKETVDFDFGPETSELFSERWADSFMVKLGPDGSFIWVIKLNPDKAYLGRDVFIDEKDNIYVAGENHTSIEGPDGWLGITNIFVNGYSPEGAIISVGSISSDGTIFVKKLSQGADGNFIIAGIFKEAQTIRDHDNNFELDPEFQWNYFVINLSSADVIDWMRVWGNSEWEEWNIHPSLDMTLAPDDSIIVCGEFMGYVDFDSTDHDVVRNSGWNGEEWREDGFLMSLSPNGNFFEGERDLSAEVVTVREFSSPVAPNYTHRLLGIWDVEIDPGILTAKITEDTDAFDRFDIPDTDRPTDTGDVLDIRLESYDPQTSVLTCEITLTNPFPDCQAYCGRLIVGSNEDQEISGIDGFTPLWEEEQEDIANNYFGFPQPSTTDPYPFFNPGEKYTRRFEILNVNQDEPCSFRFVADMSANGPPLEPIMLTDFEFEGYFTGEGSECYYVSSSVIDAQGDDKEVLVIQMPFESYCGQATFSETEEKFILCNDNETPPGEYQVVLRAISDDAPGLPAYQVTTLHLGGEGPQPEATFTYMTAQRPWSPGDVITFDAGDSGVYVKKYFWDWDDGQTLETEDDRTTHFFENVGTYEVSLVVQTGDVLSDPYFQQLIIVGPEGELVDITPVEWNFTLMDVAVVGEYAYVAADETVLLVFDVSDRAAPKLISVLDLPGQAVEIKADQNNAYLACKTGGLQIVDIQDPGSPVVVAEYSQNNLEIRCVDLHDDLVFICGGAVREMFPGQNRSESDDLIENLREIINDPDHNITYMAISESSMTTYRDSQPYLVLESEGNGTITVQDKYGEHIADVVLNFDGSLSIVEPDGDTLERIEQADENVPLGIVLGFNISDPSDPQEISEIITSNNSVGAMDIFGDYLYFSESFEIVLNKVNIERDPSSIERTFDLPDSTDHEPFNFAVHNGYAYFEGVFMGTYTLGVDEPATLRELKEIPLPFSSAFDFQEQYLFSTGPMVGIAIGDISNPGEVQIISGVEGIYPDAIEVFGNTLYAVNAGSLQIFDITDIESPVRMGSYNSFGRPESVIFNGDYIYVPDFDSGWLVFNNSDPANPVLERACDIPSANEVVIEGDYAYTTGYPGINIVDITDPANPELVSESNFGRRSSGIAYNDGYVYTVYSNSSDYGIRITDVSNPEEPSDFFQAPIPGKFYDIEIARGYAYVANNEEGLTIVDINPPEDTHVVETIELNDRPTIVELYEDHVLVTGQDSMFTVLRINSPGECEIIRELILDRRVYDMFVGDGLVYLSCNNENIIVLDIYPPSETQQADPIRTDFTVMSFRIHDGYGYITTNESSFHILDLP